MITGASGFIGSALRRRLAVDFDLLCVDLFPATETAKGEVWQIVDVTDSGAIAKLFANLRRPLAGLVHLAWYYDFSNQPHPGYDAAVRAIAPLAEGFSSASVPDAPFIFASSMAAMAPTEPGHKQTPDWPRSEAWQYPASKVRAERQLRSLSVPRPIVELVLAAVYSDSCELVPLYQSIERIRVGSMQSWFYPGRTDRGLTYVHLDDAVEAIRCALTTRFSGKVHRVLVGEAEPVTNEAIFASCARVFDRSGVAKIKVPAGIASLGARAIGIVDRENFVQPWMIKFAEEHFEFDLSETQNLMSWSPVRKLSATLPKMLEFALRETEEWHRLNQQRPWQRRSP